jgi:hypothetical protein
MTLFENYTLLWLRAVGAMVRFRYMGKSRKQQGPHKRGVHPRSTQQGHMMSTM